MNSRLNEDQARRFLSATETFPINHKIFKGALLIQVFPEHEHGYWGIVTKQDGQWWFCIDERIGHHVSKTWKDFDPPYEWLDQLEELISQKGIGR